MIGDVAYAPDGKPAEQAGLIPRAIWEIFEHETEFDEDLGVDLHRTGVTVSFLEVYNEQVWVVSVQARACLVAAECRLPSVGCVFTAPPRVDSCCSNIALPTVTHSLCHLLCVRCPLQLEDLFYGVYDDTSAVAHVASSSAPTTPSRGRGRQPGGGVQAAAAGRQPVPHHGHADEQAVQVSVATVCRWTGTCLCRVACSAKAASRPWACVNDRDAFDPSWAVA